MVKTAEATGLPWPEPPLQTHRLRLRQRIAGWFLVVFCGAIALALPVLVFGFTDEGQDLALDTAISLGLGSRIEGAGIVPERCSYRSSSGRYSISGYECDIVILQRQPDGKISRTMRRVSVGSERDAEQAREARRLFGAIGLRWPFGVMWSRWLQMMPVFIGVGVTGTIALFAWGLLRGDRALLRAAREGRIVPADLLYFHDGRWHFAYRDARGRQRFGKIIGGGVLLRDGLVTQGAVLLACNGRAWLIFSNMYPLLLKPEDANRVQAAAQAMHGTSRRRLPPLADEARSPADRLDAIRTLLLAKDKRQAERAYELAWRQVWDFDDLETATEACNLRHQAGKQLGPKRTLELLRQCRERYQALGSV